MRGAECLVHLDLDCLDTSLGLANGYAAKVDCRELTGSQSIYSGVKR